MSLAIRRVGSTQRLVRWLFVCVVAAIALLALNRFVDFQQPAPSLDGGRPADGVLVGLPANYSEALDKIDVALATARKRAETRGDEWLMHDVAARAWLARARLTGSYEDYASASAELERSFAVASPGTGPHMTAAVLAFSMHRLGEADAMLDKIDRYAVREGAADQAETAAMRGDIAFYRGRYGEALAAYDAADALVPGTADFRRAVYHSKTGRPDLAGAYFDKADRARAYSDRSSRGRYELQRGILDLDRGRWDEALGHFQKADRIFPGYWLIEEHIAEVMSLKGDLAGAEKLYLGIVRRTGHPEFMDALAGIAARRGDDAAAAGWTRRADAEWRERLRLFPEAAYGHALDHCVQKGDWRCALDLARRNHQARPYGDAKIAMAEALLHNGRIPEARSVIEAVLASPWRTAELHTVAAEIYNSAGEASKVGEQRGLALAINPHAIENVPLPRLAGD